MGQHYALWLEEKGLSNWRDYFSPPQKPPQRFGEWELPAELHYTTWTAERTIAQLEQHAESEQPFFLWASFHDPHPPYTVPAPWAMMYDPADMEPGTLEEGELETMVPPLRATQEEQADFSQWQETPHGNHGFSSHRQEAERGREAMAIYYGMTSFMDEQIGRILARLEELGMADNTIIVFTSDHGHFLGQHGLWLKGPFHFEDVVRVPFIVRWPKHVKAGERNAALQSLVDLAPTFLNAVGEEVPVSMQGVSQLDVWQGKEAKARDEVLVEMHHQPTRLNVRSYIDERWKLTVWRGQEWGELFDLQNDPEERRNLWNDAEYATTKCELLEAFVQAELNARSCATSEFQERKSKEGRKTKKNANSRSFSFLVS